MSDMFTAGENLATALRTAEGGLHLAIRAQANFFELVNALMAQKAQLEVERDKLKEELEQVKTRLAALELVPGDIADEA